jgi:hypothetical protein
MITEEYYARNEKILHARRSGKTCAEIGKLVGLSGGRVSEICYQQEMRQRVLELKPELRLSGMHRIEHWFEKIYGKYACHTRSASQAHGSAYTPTSL